MHPRPTHFRAVLGAASLKRENVAAVGERWKPSGVATAPAPYRTPDSVRERAVENLTVVYEPQATRVPRGAWRFAGELVLSASGQHGRGRLVGAGQNMFVDALADGEIQRLRQRAEGLEGPA